MTDGLIGNDAEVLAEVKKRLGEARIFSFGVGSEPNRHLLESLARLGRGASAFVGLDDSGELAADLLFRRIEHPAMTDLRIDWDRMAVSDVHPDPLPDLFVGQPVILTGRFQGEGASTIAVRGRVGGRPVELQVPVNLDEPGLRHKALAAVWARSKIESLRDELLSSRAPGELRREIRRMALHYGLVSEFTSVVAVDSLTSTSGDHGTTVPVAVPVPEGVRYDTTVAPRPLR
jgi:Ca-activated chloride channel family protein